MNFRGQVRLAPRRVEAFDSLGVVGSGTTYIHDSRQRSSVVSLSVVSLSLYTSLESHAKIRDSYNYIDFVFHYYFKM